LNVKKETRGSGKPEEDLENLSVPLRVKGKFPEWRARRKTMEAVQSAVAPYIVSQLKSRRTTKDGATESPNSAIYTIFYVADPSLDGAASVPRPADPEISIVVFLDTNDQRKIATVLEKIAVIRTAGGYDEERNIDIRQGSIFRKAKSAIARGISSEAVADRLTKVERALELAYLDDKQANVDSVEASAVRQLIESVQDINRACMRVGSIFLVKFQTAGESVVLIRNLSQIEIRALERCPEIQARPEAALNALATVVESMESINAIGAAPATASDSDDE
jgi:hypothetical protein